MSRREAALAVGLSLAIFVVGLGRPMLIDPWETHYGEVARRILADDDWIRLQWAEEGFRSKPALVAWLIAGSLRLHGLAAGGGRPGELVASAWTEWAARLPFALFGALGLLALFVMLRRLVSRATAWLALVVLGTCPMYLLLGRQAITDMPMVATTIGAVALFALALLEPEAKARPLLGRLTGVRLVQLAIAAWVLVQIAYATAHLGTHPAPGAGPYDPRWPIVVPTAVGLAALGILWRAFPSRERRHGYLYAAYALLGVGVLAKGPPGLAVVALTGLGFLAATRRWRALARLRLLDGLLIVLLVAAPWHGAMALEDGVAWVSEYIGHHWLSRAAGGAHSANAPGTETFRYYAEQLGYGVLPWIALVPAALGAAARAPTDTRGQVRLLALLWASLGLLLFTGIQTRFHHYVAPALGGVAILIAMLLEDALRGRLRGRDQVLLVAGAILAVPIAADLAADPAIFLELVTYRYDRPWPAGVDLRLPAALLAATSAGAALLLVRWRRSVVALVAAAAGTWLFLVGPYMEAAAPHWGQRALAETYYAERAPGDPLVAWQLYWRGEVFWTHGEVRELRHGTAARLREVLDAHPDAERIYVITEAGRRRGLRAAVPAALRESFEVEDKSSNKFVLVSFAREPVSGTGASSYARRRGGAEHHVP